MNKGGSLVPRLPGEDLGNEAIKMAGEIVNLRVQGKGKGYLKAPKQQHSLNIHFIKDGNQAQKKVGHPIRFGSGMSSKFLLVKNVWTQSASSKYKVFMRRKGGRGDEGRKGRRGKEKGGEGSCHKPPT